MEYLPKELAPIVELLNLNEMGFEYLPTGFHNQHRFYAEDYKYKFQISDGIWTVWVDGKQERIVSTSQQLFIALSDVGFDIPEKYLRSSKIDKLFKLD